MFKLAKHILARPGPRMLPASIHRFCSTPKTPIDNPPPPPEKSPENSSKP